MRTKTPDTIIRITVEGGIIQNVDFLKTLGPVQVQVMDFDTDGITAKDARDCGQRLRKTKTGSRYVETTYEGQCLPKKP